MKSTLLPLILFACILYGCSQIEQRNNHFSSDVDTLVIRTEKHKGQGPFSGGAMSLALTDTSERLLYPIILPDNISKIKVAFCFVDIKAWLAKRYKNGESKLEYLLDYIADNKIDTLQIPSVEDNYVTVMTGYLNISKVYIVDENDNNDFRDDSIRFCRKYIWGNYEDLAPCKYKVYNGQSIVPDSSWLKIGMSSDSSLIFSYSHHQTADFTIDANTFTIGIADEQSGFVYEEPVIALLAVNGNKKDTILLRDKLYRGEYIKLHNLYYKFANLSNGGEYLTLVKENDFESKFGTQVGVLAPEFSCRSYTGDTLNSKDLHDKPLMIANISGCTSGSFSLYSQMTEKYKDEFHILGLEPRIDKDYGGTLIDTEDQYNKGIYDNFRHAYSSYTCYLIDTSNRIINKFSVFDWEKNLPEIKMKSGKD